MKKLKFDDTDIDTTQSPPYLIWRLRLSVPGAHKHRQTRKMLQDVARVWPASSQHLTTRSNNVARCYVKMLRAFGRAFREAILGVVSL